LLGRRLGVRIGSGWARQVSIAATVAASVMAAGAQIQIPSPIDAVVVAIVGLGAYALALWLQDIRPTSTVSVRPPRAGASR
jgi:hypothetical protein